MGEESQQPARGNAGESLQRGRFMGLIVNFNDHASRSFSKASRVSIAGSAEIVIFPGVRYERYAGDVKDTTPRITKRDRIELPD